MSRLVVLLSQKEWRCVDLIARRINALARASWGDSARPRSRTDIAQDLAAVHRYMPLDFAALSRASDDELIHDIGGIAYHLDQYTGQLRGDFRPIYCQQQEDAAKAAGGQS